MTVFFEVAVGGEAEVATEADLVEGGEHKRVGFDRAKVLFYLTFTVGTVLVVP